MELNITLPHGEHRLAMTGAGEQNLKLIREALGVRIAARNGSLRISGDEQAVSKASHLLNQLAQAAQRNRPLTRQQLLDLIAQVHREPIANVQPDPQTGRVRQNLPADGLDVYLTGRRVNARTAGQLTYLQTIYDCDLSFCCGPAGSGKTYLAVAGAVSMLKHGHVRKIVLVRPAVEAGEKLGFLPGTMQEKINPYLRPLIDALHDMMGFDQLERFMASDVVEIIPLAFMRGRTLNDAMIILDEAQNTTRLQMLMFLTRMGHGSKMVVTGDTSQIDLEEPTESGLIDAARRLRRVNGVGFVTLDGSDIVRHNLVQRVVEAYGDRTKSPESQIETDS